LILFLIYLQSRRKSLLYSEPWSIAGLSCLVADYSTLPDVFGTIEANDSGKALRKEVVGSDGVYRLVESTYHYSHFRSGLHSHLGIEMIPEEPGKPWLYDHSPLARQNTIQHRPRVHRPLVLKGFVLFLYGIFLSGILTMVLIYRWSHIVDYEKFMSGQGPRVRLFMITVGIIIRSLWEPIEKGTLLKSHELSAALGIDRTVRGAPPRSLPKTHSTPPITGNNNTNRLYRRHFHHQRDPGTLPRRLLYNVHWVCWGPDRSAGGSSSGNSVRT